LNERDDAMIPSVFILAREAGGWLLCHPLCGFPL
jgi:hypothetical protein